MARHANKKRGVGRVGRIGGEQRGEQGGVSRGERAFDNIVNHGQVAARAGPAPEPGAAQSPRVGPQWLYYTASPTPAPSSRHGPWPRGHDHYFILLETRRRLATKWSEGNTASLSVCYNRLHERNQFSDQLASASQAGKMIPRTCMHAILITSAKPERRLGLSPQPRRRQQARWIEGERDIIVQTNVGLG